MSRRDFYHEHVRNALIKAGWTITDDQLPLRFFTSRLYIDLAASKVEEDGSLSLITVEVKNFRVRVDYVNEFQKAVGQYIMYRHLLRSLDFSHTLYLAIPENDSRSFFRDASVQSLLAAHDIKLLIFDPTTQTIVRWNL